MRSNIFKGVAFVVFLIGAILESAHYFDLIERLIPAWLAPLINERVNFVLMTVGLLISRFSSDGWETQTIQTRMGTSPPQYHRHLRPLQRSLLRTREI